MPRVDKIVGPGNRYVAAAKKLVAGECGIDFIAGPSELVLVGGRGNAEWIAADLVAQAEHDPGTSILATPSLTLAEGVLQAHEVQSARLTRRDAIVAALSRYSAILVTPDLDAACDLANQFATEHLQIQTRQDARCLERIRNAGALFIGPHTPVPVGDYYAGPSHVLPTGGTARFFSPLSANDFIKSSSVIRYDATSLTQDSAAITAFAECEGLTAHAAAGTNYAAATGTAALTAKVAQQNAVDGTKLSFDGGTTNIRYVAANSTPAGRSR